MLTRLLYHSFWNFYDHLGLLILVGIGQALLLTGAVMVLFATAGSVPWWPHILAFVAITSVFFAVPLAGMLTAASKAARGVPARLPDFVAGMKSCSGRVLLLVWLLDLAIVLCAVNLSFYLAIDDGKVSRGWQYGSVILAGLHGWFLLLLAFIATPVFCAATSPGSAGFRTWLRNALLAVVLAPVLWISVTAAAVFLLALAFWSKFGLLFYLPIMVVVAQTAYFLTMQYADFLAAAREDLGPGASLRALKARARDLAVEWELAQPRRTAKELIRPWEY